MRRNAASNKKVDLGYKKEKYVGRIKYCLENTCFEIFGQFYKSFTNFNFTTQSILVFTPLMIILGIVLILSHWNEYQTKFIQDYILLYNNKILFPIIENKNNFVVQLENLGKLDKFNSNYKTLLFNKIYCKELANKNILSDDQAMQNMEQFGNIFNKEKINKDFNFTITQIDLENNLNKENSYNLGNLITIIYLNTPLLIQNENLNENNLLQFYFMAYPLNDKNNSIYFHYPINKNFVYYNNINFKPYDIISDPNLYYLQDQISDNNWFSNYDSDFLSKVNNQENGDLDQSSLSMIYLMDLDVNKNINNYYLPFIQFVIEVNNNKIIIDIVSKIKKEDSRGVDIQAFSLFNLENNLDGIISKTDQSEIFDSIQKTNNDSDLYIDDSHLISSAKTLTLMTPEIYEIYARDGLISKNSTLNVKGVNMDVLEFKNFNNLEDYYDINQYFKADLQIYSVIYFYNSFYLKLMQKYNTGLLDRKNISEGGSFILNNEDNSFIGRSTYDNDILLKIGINDSSTINEICSNFNLSNYNSILNSYADINCFNEMEINIYSSLNETSYSYPLNTDTNYFNSYTVLLQDLFKPNCYCIPFYCIQMNNDTVIQNFIYDSNNNIQSDLHTFAKELTLPSKCTIQLNGYVNTKSFDPNIFKQTAFDFKFIADNSGIEFDPSKSVLNVFMTKSNTDGELSANFTNDLNTRIYFILVIYSILMVIFMFILLYLIYFKSGSMRKIILNFEDENKSAFIKSNKELTKDNFVIEIINNEKEEKKVIKRTTIFKLRENKVNTSDSNNSEAEILKQENGKTTLRTESSYNTIASGLKNSNLLKINPNSINETIKYENESGEYSDNVRNKLATIKEFNEGFTENDESKYKIGNDNKIESENSNLNYDNYKTNLENANIELTLKNEESKKIKSDTISDKSFSTDKNKIEECNLAYYKDYDTTLVIKPQESFDKINIPDDIKNITDLKFNNLSSGSTKNKVIKKEIYSNELIDIFTTIKSNLELFEIDFNLENNINEKHLIIQKYQYLNENLKKYAQLFDPTFLDNDFDLSHGKDISKFILYEVVSTEFCNYQGMCYNFRFNFTDNTSEDTTMIQNILSKNEIKETRKSIFLANHITNIKSNLKLIEKDTIFDKFNNELECQIITSETVVENASDITVISNIKSIVNYYLENIHLQWIKQIYENNLSEMEN